MIQRTLITAVLSFAALTTAASAQVTDSVRGRLVGADGNSVADERVVLHRVVGQAGANIAETRSDADGAFVIPVDSADNTEAVYFLAARWDGELYIGEAFRAPFQDTDYVLQVGVPGTSASALLEGAPSPQTTMPPAVQGGPATGTSWLLFAVPLIAILGFIVYLLLRGRAAISPRRALLRRIAELDLRHAASPGEDYRAERAALIEQLRDLPA